MFCSHCAVTPSGQKHRPADHFENDQSLRLALQAKNRPFVSTLRHPAVSSRLAFLEAQGYPRKTQLVDEALVNVNQTIGRGLRSAGDYCVFILCDERYATQRVRHGLTAVPHNGHPRLLMPFDAAEVEAQVASHLAKFLPEQPHSPDLL